MGELAGARRGDVLPFLLMNASTQRYYSWNVNGIRAAIRNGLLQWITTEQPAVLCLQETKADLGDLSAETCQIPGYEPHWATAERKGYSGVATYSRQPVRSWRAGIGIDHFDNEGRVVVTDLGEFDLYNVYFPNGKASPERLAYKFAFYQAFLEHINAQVRAGRPSIFCGDVNTAHRAIDLARPAANANVSGFLPEERACLDHWAEQGWVDTFRHFHPDERGAYSWWSLRTDAREKNIGWRLDYFFVHESFLHRVKDAGISAEVRGADHCPVWLELHE